MIKLHFVSCRAPANAYVTARPGGCAINTAINSCWSLCPTPEAGKAGVFVSLLPKRCSCKPRVEIGTSVNGYDSCSASEPFTRTTDALFFCEQRYL